MENPNLEQKVLESLSGCSRYGIDPFPKTSKKGQANGIYSYLIISKTSAIFLRPSGGGMMCSIFCLAKSLVSTGK